MSNLCSNNAQCSDRQSECAIRPPLSFLEGSVITSYVIKTGTWTFVTVID